VIPVQGPIDLPVGIGGRSGGILILALVHDLQVHPVPVLALIVLLHAAGDIAGVRITPALSLAGLVILDGQFQRMCMFMGGKARAARKQHYRQHQEKRFHAISNGALLVTRLTRAQLVDHVPTPG